MEIGVFIPIGNNGWLISTTSPQYMPSFELNKAGHAQGRALRPRLRAVDDQAARLRRQERVLGPQPRELHPDGRPGRRHLAHQTLCHGADAGRAAGDRRAHGATIDSISNGRFGLNVITGWQTAGIRPDGPVARRRVLRPPLPLRRRIRPDPARPVGDGRVGLQGRVLHHERLPAEPPPAGRHEDHLRRPERRRPGVHRQYADYNFCFAKGINTPTACADTVARMQSCAAETGRKVASYALFMVIAGETDAEAEAKWAALQGRRRPRGAGLAGRAGGGRQESDRRQQCRATPSIPKSTVNINIGRCWARMPRWRGCWTRWRPSRPGRRAAHLRRVRERHRDLRRAHPAADEEPPPCRTPPPRPPHDPARQLFPDRRPGGALSAGAARTDHDPPGRDGADRRRHAERLRLARRLSRPGGLRHLGRRRRRSTRSARPPRRPAPPACRWSSSRTAGTPTMSRPAGRARPTGTSRTR